MLAVLAVALVVSGAAHAAATWAEVRRALSGKDWMAVVWALLPAAGLVGLGVWTAVRL